MNSNTSIEELREMVAENTKGFAELRELFKETDQKFKETDQRFKETDEKFKETDEKFKETDEKFKETDLKIKAATELFTTQWGKLMESLVEGDLVPLLQARGIEVNRTSLRESGNFEGENYEFDIIAHNGTEIVIVEVKTTLRVKHVKSFIENLNKVKTWIPAYKNFKIYGAIAFLKAEEKSDVFANTKQLFVIKATGNSASIVNNSDFIPKAF